MTDQHKPDRPDGDGLLPCPFCGPGNSMVDPWYDDVSKRWAVGCGRCGSSSGRSVHAEGSKEAAIKSWNTRGLTPASLIALRDNLREAWSALSMIRETVETLGPVGCMASAEHLEGPTFIHEAEEIVKGVRSIVSRFDAQCADFGVKYSQSYAAGLANQAITAPPKPAPDAMMRLKLSDIVRVNKCCPHYHEWRSAELKVVSLRVDPEGKQWISVIEGAPKHRGNGVYDGETTDFDADYLTVTSSTPVPPADGARISGDVLEAIDAIIDPFESDNRVLYPDSEVLIAFGKIRELISPSSVAGAAPKEPTPEMAVAGRKALAVVADRMEEAKLLATSSIDFWQRVGHEPANEIFKAMIAAAPSSLAGDERNG